MNRRLLHARVWLEHKGLFPRGKLSFFTLYVLGLDLLLLIIQQIAGALGSSYAAALTGWIIFLTIFAMVLLLLVGASWASANLLWRMRTRLLVTYTFIGVIPLILLFLLAGLAFYLFSMQFAAYIFTARLDSDLRSLEVSNARLAGQMATYVNAGRADYPSIGETLRIRPNHDVFAWINGQLVLSSSPAEKLTLSPAARQDFTRVVEDQGIVFLRSVVSLPTSKGKLLVISSRPVDQHVLSGLGSDLGEVTWFGSEGGTRSNTPIYSAGNIPPPRRALDLRVDSGADISMLDWKTGNEIDPAQVSVRTRVSKLFDLTFSSLGSFGSTIEFVLFVLLIVFVLFEFAAWWVGSRLSGSITRAVGQLYQATTHINRGDFSRRIPVTSNDQLAALANSFNSMTASIEKLILEQKEKQRLQNEITIAQEVQAQLFPRQIAQLPSLEVHGFCKPARSVSGDYYDFLSLGPERLLLAVGDVSGKGISAALLMATIHSAVRAYSMEGIPALRQVQAVGAGPMLVSQGGPVLPGAEVCPSTLLSLLNHQLFHSTPLEKYATLFLAMYDAPERRLVFSNAGHLPPLVLTKNGAVRRLEDGGTVVGLFDNISYDESSVQLHPGEIFLAYSDGVTEPENDFGEFGEQRLIELVDENRDLPLGRICEIVTSAVNDWIGGAEQPDDVTLVLARSR
ncbi:MAG TPA: SpoIIE family protein phosphatase [Terriglobales bacterium]|nr:SpoIIE family protein phosphatase [Terriglobales bacterium]